MSSNFLVLPTTLFFSWASPFSGVLLTLVLPSLASRILIGFVFLWVLDCGIFGSVSVLFSSFCRPLFPIWSWRICRPLVFVVHCPFCFSVYNLWFFGLAQPLLLSVVYFLVFIVHVVSQCFTLVYLWPLLIFVCGSFWLGADYQVVVLVD